MHRAYDLYHVCKNCMKVYVEHARKKCLYEPTWFQPVFCILCDSSKHCSQTTAVVNGRRYFLCDKCNSTIMRGRYKYMRKHDSQFEILIRVFLSQDILISRWINSEDY